ncbi:hypothetical protein D3C71_1661050 [compost metagenome]
MIHCIFDVVDQNVGGQQAVDGDHLLGMLDVFTLVIEVLTRCQVVTLGATHYREGSGLAVLNGADHMLVHGHRAAHESSQDFATEDLQEHRQFVSRVLTLALVRADLLTASCVCH